MGRGWCIFCYKAQLKRILSSNRRKGLDPLETANGVLSDQFIELKVKDSATNLKLRLITYRSNTGHILKFLTNHFSYKDYTIALIYKNRWSIKPFFKQLKQNYQLSYFFSDSREGIKSQIWIALIANLIFTVIYSRLKEAEQFVTMVSMAKNNLGSYICLITILRPQKLQANERDNGKMQLDIFETLKGRVFGKINNST